MLEVVGIGKSFSGFRALTDVSFTVGQAEITAVIGPNGAGKSTLFNVITGHIAPDAGKVLLRECDITGAPPYRICRMGMGRSFQRTNIFANLTVFENIQAALIAHRSQGSNFWSRADTQFVDETNRMLLSLGLLELADQPSATLSHGNQKQIELGIALAGDPDLLLLDEPTAGMSATETRETIRLLQTIARQRNLTLLFTEHDMDFVFSIAQQIVVLHQGRVIADGPPDRVRNSAEVKRVYLGSAG